MDTFMTAFGLENQSDDQYANTKGWIISIATAGAVFGCLGCMSATQRFGRRIPMIVGTVVYMAGIFGQVFCHPSLGGLYASRFVAGMGIGVTTVIPSIYLSEIAPQSIRGLCTLQYAACQQLGVVFGFFFNYGVTKHHSTTNLQWQLPTVSTLPSTISDCHKC
jgi:MFS family permease